MIHLHDTYPLDSGESAPLDYRVTVAERVTLAEARERGLFRSSAKPLSTTWVARPATRPARADAVLARPAVGEVRSRAGEGEAHRHAFKLAGGRAAELIHDPQFTGFYVSTRDAVIDIRAGELRSTAEQLALVRTQRPVQAWISGASADVDLIAGLVGQRLRPRSPTTPPDDVEPGLAHSACHSSALRHSSVIETTFPGRRTSSARRRSSASQSGSSLMPSRRAIQRSCVARMSAALGSKTSKMNCPSAVSRPAAARQGPHVAPRRPRGA